MTVISTIEDKINDSLKDKPKEQLDKLYKTLDLDLNEIIAGQNLQSRLFASGLITQEIAQFMYSRLNKYKTISLTERIIVLQLLKELTILSLKNRGK